MNTPTETIKCFDCEGRGYLMFFLRKFTLPCKRCHETGQIPAIQAEWKQEGEKHRAARLERRETMRDAAKRLKIDCSVFSQAERGWMDPRQVFEELKP